MLVINIKAIDWLVTVDGFDGVILRVKVLLYLTYESFAVGRC